MPDRSPEPADREAAVARATTPDAVWGIEYGWDAAMAAADEREQALKKRADLYERQLKAIDAALPEWESPGRDPNECVGRVQTVRNLIADRAQVRALTEALREAGALARKDRGGLSWSKALDRLREIENVALAADPVSTDGREH